LLRPILAVGNKLKETVAALQLQGLSSLDLVHNFPRHPDAPPTSAVVRSISLFSERMEEEMEGVVCPVNWRFGGST